MMKVLLFLAFLAVASAFVGSRMGRVASRATSAKQLNMAAPADVVIDATNVLSKFSHIVAGETDFGGYAGPAGSLILIGILILALAPPLAAKEN